MRDEAVVRDMQSDSGDGERPPLSGESPRKVAQRRTELSWVVRYKFTGWRREMPRNETKLFT